MPISASASLSASPGSKAVSELDCISCTASSSVTNGPYSRFLFLPVKTVRAFDDPGQVVICEGLGNGLCHGLALISWLLSEPALATHAGLAPVYPEIIIRQTFYPNAELLSLPVQSFLKPALVRLLQTMQTETADLHR